MGVPGFFLWLWKKYKNKKFVLQKNEISKDIIFDYLLLDANCLIHPMCFKILAENKNFTNKDNLEKKMIQQVLLYIDYLIDFIKPKVGVYLAIDGVAPIAKIKQQRSRRFKSVSDRNLWNNIKKKHKQEISNFWNNSAITPGTKFMEKLSNSILQWADTKSIQIIYSSSNTPSEGEHKLLQFIRSRQKNKIINTYVIYGLDADLIFLALSTNCKNMFLLREAVNMNKQKSTSFDELNLVCIDTMKKCIYDTIKNKLKQKILTLYAKAKIIENKLDTQDNFNEYNCIKHLINTNQVKLMEIDNKLIPKPTNIIKDFILICYLLGNDFLPHIPSLNIYKNGMDNILDTYTDTIIELDGAICLQGKMNKISINYSFLLSFLSKLSINEDSNLKNLWTKKRKRYFCKSSEPYEKEIHYIENLKFKINDPIQLGSDDLEVSRKKYYKHYFHVDESELETFSEKIAHHYLIGIEWVAKYYFDKCPSWNWYFPFDHAPFITDIFNYLNKHKSLNHDFVLGKALKPFEQLLSVLPPQSAYLLPEKLQKIMLNANSSLSHLYPMYFQQDFLNKNKYWQAIPLLPQLEINLVKRAFNKYKKNLNKSEINRNKIADIYKINI